MSFQESQRLNLGLRIAIGIGMVPALFVVGRAYQQEPSTNTLYILLSVIALSAGLFFLLLNGQAKTRIDSAGIHYIYWPFVAQWRTIPWSDISQVQIKGIAPLTDFGGWGYKFGRRKKGIILSGDKAIYIQLQNNRLLVITTNQPKLAHDAVERWAEEKLG